MNEEYQPGSPTQPSPEPDWRETLLRQCHSAIVRLPAEPPAPCFPFAEDDLDPPSLYQFYEELAVLRGETRQGNRRIVEAFKRFSDALDETQSSHGKLRELLAKVREEKSGVSRNLALALIDIADRLDRLREAARAPVATRKGWFSSPAPHPGWENLKTAIEILGKHFRRALTEAGIERISTAGEEFDPLWMKAAGGEDLSSANGEGSLEVIEEILPGYRQGAQCLRPAEVWLTRARKEDRFGQH